MLARRLLTLAVAFVALACPATVAAAKPTPEAGLIPGVVTPPPLGLALHDDVISAPVGSATAAGAPPTPGTVEKLTTASGSHVTIRIVAGYEPDPTYGPSVAAFLDSLLHGAELDGLTLFVVLPEEMRATCGGAAAACYYPKRNTMYVVGEASYGGFPTSYVVAHEYGHRIAHKRQNTPFPGGALLWGTKRWATHEQVCRRTVQGQYAPGSEEGNDYYRNPGEGFAEAYAWYHYGPNLVEWEYVSSLRPNAAAFAAIERDVLEPWAPTKLAFEGSLSRPHTRKVFRLQLENDGLVKVRMSGAGDLDIGLLDGRGRFVAVSTKRGTAREQLNYLACGERKLKLVVEDVSLPGEYGLQVSLP